MTEKKILFMTASSRLVRMFWNAECEAKTREYGFKVDMPAKDDDLTNQDWASILPEYDAIVTSWESPVCTRDFLQSATRAKVIGHCAGSVVAVVDESTFDTEVHVTTSNPVMAEAVAEWSLMATIISQRRLPTYAKLRRPDRVDWSEKCNMQDIKHMAIGLWGMGDTTIHLLKFLAPLHPGRILVCSRHSTQEQLQEFNAEKSTLDELLRESDVFHCLVGANKENYQRLGAKEFAMMKDGATFVNGGRARLTKEDELIAELKKGRINAFLDVFYEEPMPEDSPFNELDNVILTPHNAGYTGRDRFLPFLLDEFHRFFNGEAMHSDISKNRFLTMTSERMGR